MSMKHFETVSVGYMLNSPVFIATGKGKKVYLLKNLGKIVWVPMVACI